MPETQTTSDARLTAMFESFKEVAQGKRPCRDLVQIFPDDGINHLAFVLQLMELEWFARRFPNGAYAIKESADDARPTN